MTAFVEEIRYEADIRDLEAKLDRIDSSHKRIGDTAHRTGGKVGAAMGRATVKVGLLAAGLTAAAGAAAVRFGPALADSGTALLALDQKAATVFSGQSLAQVERWADGIAGSLGLTNTQAIALAAGTADLLKPMGFTAQAAADMATQTNDLAGALGAWSGGQFSAAEASEILTKAYLGEREGLKQLGISIMEADVQARLAAKGQEKLTGAALEQAKAQATMELIFEKSTDAQEAWANGSMDAVKANNENKAAIERLKEGFVRVLTPAIMAILPHATRFLDWAGKHLPPALEKVGRWLGQHVPRAAARLREIFVNYLIPAGEKVRDWAVIAWEKLKQLGEWMNNNRPTVAAFAAALAAMMIVKTLTGAVIAFNAALAANPIVLVAIALAALVAGLVHAYNNVEWFRDLVDKAADIIVAAFEWMVEAAKSVWEWLKNLWDRAEGLRSFLANAFTAAWEAVTSAMRTVWEWIQKLWDRSEGFRAWLADVLAIAIGIIVGYFEAWRTIIETVWRWTQDLWDRSEAFRAWLVTQFYAAVQFVISAWHSFRHVLELVWGWIVNLWNISKELATYLEGPLKLAIGAAQSALMTLEGPLLAIATWLDGIIGKATTALEKLNLLQGKRPGIIGSIADEVFVVPTGANDNKPPGALARGGPAYAGNPYIVGEHRAELFVPRVTGDVIPNLPRGGDTHIHMHNTGRPMGVADVSRGLTLARLQRGA